MAKKLVEMVGFKVVECKGTDKDGKSVFEDSGQISLIAYRDGLVFPCCKYYCEDTGDCKAKTDEQLRGTCFRYRAPREK